MKTPSVRIVPPRPNLGPEAFEHRGIGAFWLFLVCIIALGMASAIYFVKLRLRKRRKDSESLAQTRFTEMPAPATDLASLVRRVRDRLTENFGEGVRAKTTEELAVDLNIKESLGPEEVSNLIGFLRATDVMRFGLEGRDDPQRILDAWSDWTERFCSAEGARSTTKGK